MGTEPLLALSFDTFTDNAYYENFNLRAWPESWRPHDYNCPESILSLLTATEDEGVNEWRRDCRKWHQKRRELDALPVGTEIEFNEYMGNGWGGPTYYTYHLRKMPSRNPKGKGFWLKDYDKEPFPVSYILRNDWRVVA